MAQRVEPIPDATFFVKIMPNILMPPMRVELLGSNLCHSCEKKPTSYFSEMSGASYPTVALMHKILVAVRDYTTIIKRQNIEHFCAPTH